MCCETLNTSRTSMGMYWWVERSSTNGSGYNIFRSVTKTWKPQARSMTWPIYLRAVLTDLLSFLLRIYLTFAINAIKFKYACAGKNMAFVNKIINTSVAGTGWYHTFPTLGFYSVLLHPLSLLLVLSPALCLWFGSNCQHPKHCNCSLCAIGT